MSDKGLKSLDLDLTIPPWILDISLKLFVHTGTELLRSVVGICRFG